MNAASKASSSTSMGGASRSTWAVVGALLATTPAFYLELLSATPSLAARTLYVVAAAAVLHRLVRRLRARQAEQTRHRLMIALEAALSTGLLLSVLLPVSSGSNIALSVRIATALLGLAYMVWVLQHRLSRGSLPVLLALALMVLALCGLGFWWLEPTARSLGEGMWLAFTTAATVGYGDMVPTTAASRIFAVFVVLLGYGVLSLVTAAVAAMWVESQERVIEREILRDLHAQIAALRTEVAQLRDAGSRDTSSRDTSSIARDGEALHRQPQQAVEDQ
jgi:voltage-gated potassium channel